MSFPDPVKLQALVKSGRYCCICHRFCGLKMELHHIVHSSEGGPDTLENCIPLCFDCHGDMRSYDSKHPKGTKYKPDELRLHRDAWYEKVERGASHARSSVYTDADRKTLEWIRRCISFGLVDDFIASQGYLSPFDPVVFGTMDDFVNSARDPSNEFLDPVLEGLRSDLVRTVHQFAELLSLRTWRTDSNLQSMPYEWKSTQHERWAETVKALRELGDEVKRAYVALVREARRQLEGS